MSESIGVLTSSKDPERVDFNAATSLTILKNKIKWEAKAFEKSSMDKVNALVKKNMAKDNKSLNKPLEYCVSLDGDTLKYFARIGSDRVLAYTSLFSAIKPHTKRLSILDGLFAYGVVNSAFIDAYKERDPMD
jgi:hypothetical protein